LIGDGGRDNEQRGRPSILVIWGDDIGISNLSCYSDGVKAASFTVDQVMDRRLGGIASRWP
jgi:arylsulfatase A-like enzyme